jgi:hypothetical protein
MFGPIADDVDEGISHLARRLERPRVVAVRPHAAVRLEQVVQALGDSNGEPFHPLRKPPAILRLDEQMDVVGLDAEVQDANELRLRRAELRENAAKHRFRSKAG